MSAWPAFFGDVPSLWLRDPLAEVLGAAAGGLVEYRYEDAVRLAGHSCPTVAGAWLMVARALGALHGDELPTRGGLRVDLRDPADHANAGVVASVFTLVTGAAGEGGFAGLGTHHGRRGLLRHGVELPARLRVERVDTGAAVWVDYRPQRVPPDPQLPPLLAAIKAGQAGAAQRARFGELFQDRVRRILLDHADDPELVEVRRP